ncbi:MAG TPA: hypothetical protein VK932_00045, partial [Kofleriaceae bacterium]|nr:hypothetical protein [Kofleriaceae bacterium]
MKKIAFAFLAALAVMSFAGCKKKGGTAEIMAKMEGFKNDMCKCAAGDKACAEKVGKDMQAYMESMKGKIPDEKSVSEADKKKSEALGMEMMKCQQTAMGMGGDMAPPAGEGATPPAGEGAAPPAGEGA